MTNLKDFDFGQLNRLNELDRYRCLMLIHDKEQFRNLQTQQLLAQMGLVQRNENNPYNWNDFKEISNQVSIRNNLAYKDSDNARQAYARAYTTSEFKELLSDINTKLLVNGWVNSPVSYPEWTRSVEVKDFKDATLISLSPFSKPSKIAEGQTISKGDFSDESETFRLETFARIFSVSYRAYINDDLEAIKTAPILMGASGRQLLEETVFSVMLSNPVLSDGVALCHGDHNNLINRCLEYG